MQKQTKSKRTHGPQRYKWRVLAKFDTYVLANSYRQGIEGENQDRAVKVHRMGHGKTAYAVKVGTPVTPCT